ncbi:MAG: glutathione S-transferase [Bdellovibrionota bacterium]
MPQPRLITIPISHYCEKARWSLDRLKVPYTEERHLQGFHFWPVHRATRNYDATPVLVTNEKTLTDSTDILRWADSQVLGVRSSSRDYARKTVDRTFEKVGRSLSDGRKFLVGERFTAADLTFAALSASVLVPENYGVALPTLVELPAEMREQVLKWRATPAGEFALRIYREHRNLSHDR